MSLAEDVDIKELVRVTERSSQVQISLQYAISGKVRDARRYQS